MYDHVMYLGKKCLLRAHNKPFCISNSKHDADLFLKHSCYSGRDCDQDRLDGSAWLHTSRAGDGFARKCACNTDDFKYGKCKNVFLWISGLLKKQMHKVSTDMTSMANRPKQMPRHASGASILRRKGSRVCALTESKHSKARFAAKWT